jgi:hypothetical protein
MFQRIFFIYLITNLTVNLALHPISLSKSLPTVLPKCKKSYDNPPSTPHRLQLLGMYIIEHL